jgi:hypothetical protein
VKSFISRFNSVDEEESQIKAAQQKTSKCISAEFVDKSTGGIN